MYWLLFLLSFLCLMPCMPAQNGFVIDHHDVDLFESIPKEYLDAARNTRFLFSDRSVGQNVNDALNFLTYPSWAQAPASARRDYTDLDWHWKTFNQTDWNAGLVPERIQFTPDPLLYNRSNWTFALRSGSWSELTQNFIQDLGPTYADSVDVWSYQFSYLNVMEGDPITDPQNGFFSDNPDVWDIHDLESFLSAYPDHKFVYWTTSLARGIGTSVSTLFNDQLRTWCQDNDRILFDFADIISHADKGDPCFDNRDGVDYISQTGQMENHPDDGVNYPAICQDYTTETDGGHLGSVSAGGIRIIKAMWVLMARIAGWDGQPTSVHNTPGSESILLLSPNPASTSSLLTIITEGPATHGRLDIVDIWGRTISSQIMTSTEKEYNLHLNLGELIPGQYVLIWSDERQRLHLFFSAGLQEW
ncbi:MAG: hypothetical protein K9I85_04640 [Saprospiraceae bacterium]|nr:hypothetical protein [Saprospiraceae bacterium]